MNIRRFPRQTSVTRSQAYDMRFYWSVSIELEVLRAVERIFEQPVSIGSIMCMFILYITCML